MRTPSPNHRRYVPIVGLLALAGTALGACENTFNTTEADPSAITEQRAALGEGEAETVCDASFLDCTARGVEDDACRARRAECVASLTEDGPRPGEHSDRACWERFDFCIANGEAPPERCRAGLRLCLGEDGRPEGGPGSGPNEDPPPCLAERAACVEAGGEPRACDEAFHRCREANRPEDGGSCGPPRPEPGVNRCQVRFRECVDVGEAPERCEHALRHCLQDAAHPAPSPEEHAARCHGRHDRCVADSSEAGLDPERCDYGLRECLANPPATRPEPEAHATECRARRAACIADGTEPERCEFRFRECAADAPEPDSGAQADDQGLRCEARFRDCLASNDADDAVDQCEAGFRRCLEADLPEPPPGPDAHALRCERGYRECVDAGREPDVCGRGFRQCMANAPDAPEPTAEGHALRCEGRFRECLAAGIPADRCEVGYRDCLATPPPVERPTAPSPELFCGRNLDTCIAGASTDDERAACDDSFRACLIRLGGEGPPDRGDGPPDRPDAP